MINDAEWSEIIAIRFGSIVMFGEKAIDTLREKQDYDQLISRLEFRMLSRLDLGYKFGEYADHAPTLFIRNRYETN